MDGVQYHLGEPVCPGYGLGTFASCRVATSVDLKQASSSTVPLQPVLVANLSNCHSSSEVYGCVGRNTLPKTAPMNRCSSLPPLTLSVPLSKDRKRGLLRDEMHRNTPRPSRFTMNNHMIRIAPKLLDVLLHPSQRLPLIKQSNIQISVLSHLLTR